MNKLILSLLVLGTCCGSAGATGSQPVITTSGSVTAGKTISILSGSETLATFEIPAEYSSSSSSMMAAPPMGMPPMRAPGNRPGGGGWGSSSGNLLLTCPALVSGSQYNINNNGTSSSATAS